MDTNITIIVMLVLVIQYFSKEIVKYIRIRHTREISKFIVELYGWLFSSTIIIYGITFGGKFVGIPVSLNFLDTQLVVFITLYTTLLLLFFPTKLLIDKIIHFRVNY